MEFLRGVLGLIGVGCAYMAGRSAVAVRRGWHKRKSLYGWIVRTLLCLIAVALPGVRTRQPVDVTDIIVWGLAAIAFAAAYVITGRERKVEDLTHTIFPDEE